MRFELVVSDAPVLDRDVLWQEFRAVTLGQMRLQHEISRQKAPSLRVPMHARAADPIGQQERAPGTDRQCCLAGVVATRERGPRRAHKQVVPHGVAELVGSVVRRKIGRGVAPWPTLDCDHPKARIGHRLGDDRACPAQPDDHNVRRRQLGRHRLALFAGQCRSHGRAGDHSFRPVMLTDSARCAARPSRGNHNGRRESRSSSTPPCPDCRRKSGQRKSLGAYPAAIFQRTAWCWYPAIAAGHSPCCRSADPFRRPGAARRFYRHT